MIWYFILGEVTKKFPSFSKNSQFSKMIKSNLQKRLNHTKMTIDLLNGTHGQYKNTNFDQFKQLLSIFFCIFRNLTGENWGLRPGFILIVKKIPSSNWRKSKNPSIQVFRIVYTFKMYRRIFLILLKLKTVFYFYERFLLRFKLI